MKTIMLFLSNDDALTAIEYALMASLIAVAIIISIKALGAKIGKTFTSVANQLSS
jgi:pilus assembly protein Flp/PilA